MLWDSIVVQHTGEVLVMLANVPASLKITLIIYPGMQKMAPALGSLSPTQETQMEPWTPASNLASASVIGVIWEVNQQVQDSLFPSPSLYLSNR